MTLDQAIHTVDELKPNQIERARKIDWLSRLDMSIYQDIMCKHERRDALEVPDEFEGYRQDTDPDTVLLAPPPYDEIYRFYLEMQIDLANQEYNKYNNSAMLYATSRGQLYRMWHREHRPFVGQRTNIMF